MTAQPISAAGAAATGPRTPEGKARCRLNAFRHGLTGHVFVFTEDEAPAYTKHHSSIHDYYRPVGCVEQSLTDQVAIGIWRLQRAMAMEEGLFAMDAATQPESDSMVGPARTWLEQGKAIDLLGKYEGRIRRSLDRDKAELQRIQQLRKEEAARAMNQAVALHNLATLEKTDYQPELYFAPHPPNKESIFSKEAVRLESARREALAGAQARLAIMNQQAKKVA
jgi:hypothetical protein